MDQNSGDLQQFIKTDSEQVYQQFYDENHCINNTNANAYVKSKISQLNEFIVKNNTFQKNMFS